MKKSLSVSICALFLVAGCVSVGPTTTPAPTTGASVLPSLGVTTPQPASQQPTSAPTVAPTIAPTLAPTLPPTATPAPTETAQATLPPSISPPSGEPQPSSSAGTGVGDRDLVFYDDMNDPTSGWQTLDGDRASISYDTGFLAVRFNVTDSWAYSARDLGTTATTVVQAANLYPDSAGGFGMLCGMKSSGTFFGARVSTDGSLAFIKVDNGTESILENKNDLNLDVTLNDSNPFALECSTSVDGVVSMIVGLSHTGPVAVYREPGGPIDGFDVTAIYAESANDAYVLGADTAAVWAAAPNGQMSDGAQALFAHIPTDLQTGCYESPIWNSEATYEVTCLEQVKGKGAEILQYQQYDDDTGMTAAYQDLVTAFGPQPDSGSCDSGPASFEWNRTGDSANSGSVQCAPQTVGIRIDWSDHLTFILSALIDLQGSYSDTYEQWRNGGPIIPQG